jgi:hypothetical protein
MTDPNQKMRPVFAPPRDLVTGNQLNHLLGAARTMMSCLQGIDPDLDDGDTPKSSREDGGVLMAAEQTFIGICNRIDEIISDTPRWDMKSQDVLEEDLSNMFKEQAKATRVHAVAQAKAVSPAIRHGALLFKLSSEAWVAYSGDLANANDSIVAIGECPEAAFANFDQVCWGKQAERAHQNLFDELLGKMKMERSKLDEKKIVVRGGDTEGAGTEVEGLEIPADSGTAGEDDQGSPEEDGISQ